MYKERVAAQVVTYFVWKGQKPLELNKIIGLMCFAEKEYLITRVARLTGDDLYYTRYGPVLANTLYRLQFLEHNEYWYDRLISKGNNRIALRKKNWTRENFDRLNDVALKILDKVHEKYPNSEDILSENLGNKLGQYRQGLPVKNFCKPIKIEDILRNHGDSEVNIQGIMEILKEQDDYDTLIENLTW